MQVLAQEGARVVEIGVEWEKLGGRAGLLAL
jgi:hypothetical protein